MSTVFFKDSINKYFKNINKYMKTKTVLYTYSQTTSN